MKEKILKKIGSNDFISKNYHVITLGMFDGVHKGHQTLLENICLYAKEKKLKSTLLTFDSHPRFFLDKNSNFKLLTLLDEKINKLEQTDLDYLIIQKFDDEFRNLTSEEFVRDILIKKYNLKALFIGHDHQFGKNREGNYEQLKILSKKYNFELIQIPEVKNNNTIISSTKIRKAILNGEIIIANNMLGSNYSICGEVISGLKLGRKIGFPTANLQIDSTKLIPKNGVYIIKTQINNQSFFGMMNIGNRPTINGDDKIQIEAHLFNFNQDIYGKIIKIELLDFIREEKKFPSIDQLIKQIKLDEIKIKNKLTLCRF